MGMFKKGDRVRLTRDNNGYGDTGDTGEIVIQDAGDENALVRFDRAINGDHKWYAPWSRLELVPVAEATGTDAGDEPKFKAGDRVRLKRDAGYIGTVKGRSSDEYRNEPAYTVNMDWYGNPETTTTWYESELEPVAVAQQPQPLRIQPGKFYITRDGRKVGPATCDTIHEYSDEGFVWRVGDYTYRSNGAVGFCDDIDDLIAEWPSEPTTHDNGSTAGFTVPLCAYEDEPGRYATELGRAYADGYAAGLRAAA